MTISVTSDAELWRSATIETAHGGVAEKIEVLFN
jgi:hypothetical protein